MSITLVAIGTVHHRLMKFALEKTIESVPIDKVKVFSDIDLNIKNSEFIQLPYNFSLFDYSNFTIKKLNDYIDTDHVLICQYDGFGVNKKYWTDKFLQYDYIGSATSPMHPPLYSTLEPCKLLNLVSDISWLSLGGGFCLRSKKLLTALQDDSISSTFCNYSNNRPHNCEDISIGIIYKDYLEKNYDIKFGSLEDSINFAAEILKGYNYCLGFHGVDLVPYFLSEEDTIWYLKTYLKETGIYQISKSKFYRFLGSCLTQEYFQAAEYIENLIKNYRV